MQTNFTKNLRNYSFFFKMQVPRVVMFIMLSVFIASDIFGQTITMSFPSGFDNCANPLPNAGNYTFSGTVNGRNEYTKPGGNPRIRWTGAQWEWQADDPTIGGINFITCWYNTNNTTTPPADCWQASFGCFLPVFTGAVTPAVSAVSITNSVANKAAGTTATWVVTTTGTIGSLAASNFSLTVTGSVTGASITSVTNVNATTWTVVANTGTGDGTIGLNLANSTGTGTAFCVPLPVNGSTYTVNNTSAPVTLSAGDIAFNGYNSASTTTDNFSFVVLKSGGLASGTKIYFTDNGYGTVASALRPGEGLLMWTATAAVPQFTVITISCNVTTPFTPSATNGTVSNILNNINLSSAGDQIIAFQGILGNPSFISAIHMNAETGTSGTNGSSTLANWDDLATGSTPFTISASRSAIPPGLTNGTNAIMIATIAATNVEFDNAVFNCTGVTNAASLSAISSANNNQANWNKQDVTVYTLPPACTYSLTASAPEINIKGNSNSIADGDVTPSTTDNTDFGNQSICSGVVSKTFVIENTGSGTLNITGSPRVTISGTNAADFTVTTQPAASVAAAGSSNFIVEFNPSGAGTRSAAISISNNDADENPYNFSIQGTGIDPEVNVQGNSNNIADGDATPTTTDHSDFGSQSICTGSLIRTYNIQNTGNSVLNITGANLSGTHAADYSISGGPSSTVAAGGSTTITVSFNPSASGLRSATLNITTNDCDEATYDFAIQGTGIDPEINIQGNSNTITDGDATPTLTDHTDFGNQSVC